MNRPKKSPAQDRLLKLQSNLAELQRLKKNGATLNVPSLLAIQGNASNTSQISLAAANNTSNVGSPTLGTNAFTDRSPFNGLSKISLLPSASKLINLSQRLNNRSNAPEINPTGHQKSSNSLNKLPSNEERLLKMSERLKDSDRIRHLHTTEVAPLTASCSEDKITNQVIVLVPPKSTFESTPSPNVSTFFDDEDFEMTDVSDESSRSISIPDHNANITGSSNSNPPPTHQLETKRKRKNSPQTEVAVKRKRPMDTEVVQTVSLSQRAKKVKKSSPQATMKSPKKVQENTITFVKPLETVISHGSTTNRANDRLNRFRQRLEIIEQFKNGIDVAIPDYPLPPPKLDLNLVPSLNFTSSDMSQEQINKTIQDLRSSKKNDIQPNTRWNDEFHIDAPNRSIHIVIDTNVLIHSMHGVDVSFERFSSIRDDHFMFTVPYIVLQELDRLKTRINSVGAAAQSAIRFINTALSNNSNHLRVQSPSDHDRNLVLISNDDDRIINCCLQLQPNYRLLLLSNDNNLRNKALSSKVYAVNCDTFVNEFSGKIRNHFKNQP